MGKLEPLKEQLWTPMVGRSVLLVLVTAIIAWGLFFYFHLDRDTSTPYDSAWAGCVRDHTHGANIYSGDELAKITAECARTTRSSQ
jgi:hypothetical protein